MSVLILIKTGSDVNNKTWNFISAHVQSRFKFNLYLHLCPVAPFLLTPVGLGTVP